jgi:hypothetical protein
MKYCPKCGARVGTEDGFCSECGCQLKGEGPVSDMGDAGEAGTEGETDFE